MALPIESRPAIVGNQLPPGHWAEGVDDVAVFDTSKMPPGRLGQIVEALKTGYVADGWKHRATRLVPGAQLLPQFPDDPESMDVLFIHPDKDGIWPVQEPMGIQMGLPDDYRERAFKSAVVCDLGYDTADKFELKPTDEIDNITQGTNLYARRIRGGYASFPDTSTSFKDWQATARRGTLPFPYNPVTLFQEGLAVVTIRFKAWQRDVDDITARQTRSSFPTSGLDASTLAEARQRLVANPVSLTQ